MLKDHYGINPDWFEITTHQKWESIENEQFTTVEEDGVLYIFFEKTSGGIDWLSNLDFFPPKEPILPIKAYSEMNKPWYCHPGFAIAFSKLLPEIDYRVRNYLSVAKSDPRINPLIRNQGYSRGGALTQACNEYVKWNYMMKTKIRTLAFASPRWIFRWGKQNVQDRMTDVKIILDDGDLVGHNPPWWTGYVHVGEKVLIGKRDFLFSSPMEHTEGNYTKLLEEYANANHKSQI